MSKNYPTKRLKCDDLLSQRDFNELPFAYINPENENIYWMCNHDQDGKITSVFMNTGIKDKRVMYLPDIEAAIEQRNLLIGTGWAEMKLPEITVTQTDPSQMNRQQRRQFDRKMVKRMKKEIREEREEEVRDRRLAKLSKKKNEIEESN